MTENPARRPPSKLRHNVFRVWFSREMRPYSIYALVLAGCSVLIWRVMPGGLLARVGAIAALAVASALVLALRSGRR